jgi:hypothetical protein
METVRGCKWVDEIVADVPYIMNETYLKEIMVKHRYLLYYYDLLSMACISLFLKVCNDITIK